MIDVNTKEVEVLPVMSTPRLDPTVAILGKYFFVAGGEIYHGKLTSVERYS